MNNSSIEYDERDVCLVLVDDEQMVVDSLRSFLELETDFQIQAFTDAAAAVDFADTATVDVVVSDFLMPGMSGLDLLRAYAEKQPQAPRILLTGYADKDSAIKAINDVGLFQYLEKPWDNEHLLLVIRNALERRFLLKALQDKIAEIDSAEGKLSDLQKDILRTFI